jgi:hypothetical protein
VQDFIDKQIEQTDIMFAKILLNATKNEIEWNDACDTIKEWFCGQYPNWWADEVLASGLAYEVEQSWKRAE